MAWKVFNQKDFEMRGLDKLAERASGLADLLLPTFILFYAHAVIVTNRGCANADKELQTAQKKLAEALSKNPEDLNPYYKHLLEPHPQISLYLKLTPGLIAQEILYKHACTATLKSATDLIDARRESEVLQKCPKFATPFASSPSAPFGEPPVIDNR